MNEHDKTCLRGLSTVEFLTPREKLALIQMRGGPRKLLDLTLPDLRRLTGRRFSTSLWNPDEILRAGEEIGKRLTEGGMESIFYEDTAYPPQLREIYDPPVTLFLRGSLPDNGLLLAGIVGTRFPTGAARTAAFRLGFELGREGIGVVSGLARGIDREAHEGCTEAGGISVAVLGNGIDLIYPASSLSAGRAILERGGAILSEYPPGVPPLRYHFPARNRIISGLCRAVVVVQAPERSGALITAEYALDQGRDLYVHAAGTIGAAGAGTRRLAESGAPMVRGSVEILRDWGVKPRGDRAVLLPKELPEGERLANLLKEEIAGACATRGGETYWRA
ncbi:MAG: DNA-processing protein DprA [Spirochaetia bacterium]